MMHNLTLYAIKFKGSASLMQKACLSFKNGQQNVTIYLEACGVAF